jgi:transcriptional regulator with XRE-family HTH domain
MTRRVRHDPALAIVVRRFRKQRGLRQADLADKVGITVSALLRIEHGQSDPRWTNVRAIARVLDMELDELGAAVEMEEQ